MKPEKLAKILNTMLYINPGEYGLFWDKNHTMPWKELYWALQRQEDLRFVRKSNIQEIMLLGIDMPFVLEENTLKLKVPYREYEKAVADRDLFVAVPLSALPFIREKGLLVPSHRSYLPLWDSEEESLIHSKPSEEEKVVIRIPKEKLFSHPLYSGGGHLFLTDKPLSPEMIIIPPVSKKDLEQLSKEHREKSRKKEEVKIPVNYGSFKVTMDDLTGYVPKSAFKEEKSSKKSAKKSDWKREARKIRKTKRTI